MSKKQQGEPKGSPKKYDYTSTKRGQKRTALDNAWAEMVSGGKYKTLRNLMRAIHAKEYALAETRPTPLALDVCPDCKGKGIVKDSYGFLLECARCRGSGHATKA